MKITEPENARSRRTRAALLAATRQLIEEAGFEAATMAAVADRAGVSRRAVYLHFGSRPELMTALFDYVSDAEHLADSLRPVWAAPDAEAALEQWARHLARYHPRILAIDLAAERVRQADPDAETHRQIVIRDQRAACRRLADWLATENRLAQPWTVRTAADMIWALMSSSLIKSLLVDCHWSTKQFADRLAVLLHFTFVCDPLQTGVRGSSRSGRLADGPGRQRGRAPSGALGEADGGDHGKPGQDRAGVHLFAEQ